MGIIFFIIAFIGGGFLYVQNDAGDTGFNKIKGPLGIVLVVVGLLGGCMSFISENHLFD